MPLNFCVVYEDEADAVLALELADRVILESTDWLSAKHDEVNDKRSAKRVLRKLTQSNGSREEQCWTDTPLAKLRARGKSNGLTEYLSEVKEFLVPLMIRPDAPGVRT